MADLLRRVRNGGFPAPVLDAVRRLQPDFARHPDHDIEQPPILCLSRLPGRAVPGVFSFIAFAMAMVILVIGVLGPRTNNRAFEEIS
jgi:hypothetical protein